MKLLPGEKTIFYDKKNGRVYKRKTKGTKTFYMECAIGKCSVKSRYEISTGHNSVQGSHECTQSQVNNFLDLNKLRNSMKELACKDRQLGPKEVYDLCAKKFKDLELPNGFAKESKFMIQYVRKKESKTLNQNGPTLSPSRNGSSSSSSSNQNDSIQSLTQSVSQSSSPAYQLTPPNTRSKSKAASAPNAPDRYPKRSPKLNGQSPELPQTIEIHQQSRRTKRRLIKHMSFKPKKLSFSE